MLDLTALLTDSHYFSSINKGIVKLLPTPSVIQEEVKTVCFSPIFRNTGLKRCFMSSGSMGYLLFLNRLLLPEFIIQIFQHFFIKSGRLAEFILFVISLPEQ